ncbi:MAG: CBS domain-containing protein [Crenarchaeota archaeon]|nr:CBS domain-containing protein [Thermoproteota archaeon]
MRTEFPKADAEEAVISATEKMVKYEYGAVLVLTEEGTLDGIMTERDVLKAIASGKDLAKLKVKDLMRKTTIVAHKDVPVRLVLQLFGAYKVRRIPVIDDDGRVLGVISSTDAVYEAIPRVLHPLAGKVGDALEAIGEIEDSVLSAAKYFASTRADGALAAGKLISQRSVIRALLEGSKPSEHAEKHISVPPEMSLRNAAILMKLNKIRFISYEKRFAFTRNIAISAADRAEFTLKSYVLVKVKPGYESDLIERVQSLKSNVVNIEIATGPYDVVLTVLTNPQEDASNLLLPILRDRDYVVDTLTLVVLGEKYVGGKGE